MPISKNIGTRDVPLKFAAELTRITNEAWDSGELMNGVTPVTQDLLRYWFADTFCDQRRFNFHQGQKQAILNTIYVHEILKSKNVFDMYISINEEILAELGLVELNNIKYSYPKYAMKMATGTGKTWVMNALLIWQYLNAKYENKPSGRYSKNFLLVAPGLIVYERLLDAYLGKETESGVRNFETSDFYKYRELFVPEAYKSTLFSFIQNSVARKEEIGRKVTGDGLIAITNWHLLAGADEEETDTDDPLENPAIILQDLRPISPGTTAGHSLNTLDNNYLKGSEIEYLAKLKDIVVINDEAHHIHEVKVAGEVMEVEWQKSLNEIASGKGERFIQIDFSATPYNVTGSGQKRTKHYFPHIIVDFDLKTAIHKGLVKTIVLDKRKEIASEELAQLDYKAVREGNNVVGLSEGQKIMLRAGLQKLRILEKQFVDFTKDKAGITNKYPKMLVICEDTKVSPLVVEYLTRYEGLDEEDVLQVDSDKKGNIPLSEWNELKRKLFNIDSYEKPKIIVSVLMLREGFDVNNICVIVPLRSSEAPILLEQIVGRGLRLMWRENDYDDIKQENRIKLLQKKQEPSNYLDILSIIEHPRFIEFYDELIKEGLVNEAGDMKDSRESIVGDLINVGLKEDYRNYDMFFPIIVKDREETIVYKKLSPDIMMPYSSYPLKTLKMFVSQKDDTFYSEEITVKTRFGNYEVSAQVFNSKSYNEYIGKIIGAISSSIERVGIRKKERFPFMQINNAELAAVIDKFIRTRLFDQPFDPFEDNNWRVLLLTKSGIVEHIIKEISKAIYEMQNNVEISEAVVLRKYFSEIDTMKMRENYSVEVSKSIYSRLPFPSNKGGFERDFIIFCDTDSEVESIIKIKENYHTFAYLNYIRKDGMIASYFPDFIVKLKDEIYLVETKADRDMDNQNVLNKEKATLDWLKKVNALKPDDRMNCKWYYVLLGENSFYSKKNNGASVRDILRLERLTRYMVEGDLFSYFEDI